MNKSKVSNVVLDKLKAIVGSKNFIDDVKNMFELFDDPMDKYTQIIELGKKNIPLEDADKNDANRAIQETQMWFNQEGK